MGLADGTILVGLGLAIGAFGTLIGAGGGFLLVPLLVLGYHFPPAQAVGTSLSLVFLNAASGSVAYLRQRRVDLSLGWKFAAATIPGAIIGAFLTRSISSSAFNLLFGIVLVAIAALLFSGIAMAPSSRAGVRQVVDASSEAHTYRVDVWKGIGIAMVIFIAGIMSIPEEYFDAARLEGGAWVRFRHVILPLSRNATFAVILLSFIGGLRTFDLIWTMTHGGPGFASDVLTSVIYKEYQAGFYGLSTAGNVVLFVLVTIIVYPLMRFFNRRELDL